MLDHTNHEALVWLDEQEYVVLPDIVKAVIYDDPIYLYGYPLSHQLLVQILRNDLWELHMYYRDVIMQLVHIPTYRILVHGTIGENISE